MNTCCGIVDVVVGGTSKMGDSALPVLGMWSNVNKKLSTAAEGGLLSMAVADA